jgi:D-mannonate dehydratase
MADILSNSVEICVGSFTTTSTTLTAVTSPTPSVKVPTTSDVARSSGKKSKTHPPKPYDIVQGMERVIDMMEETLRICERAQHNARCVAPHDLPVQSAAY